MTTKPAKLRLFYPGADTLSPYSSYLTGTWAEFVFRSATAAAWSAPTVISEIIPSSAGYVTNPQVALDASGLATVIYFGYGIEGVRQLSTTSWTAPAAVIQALNSVSSYLSADLGVDGAGNAFVAASVFDATIGVDRASVYVASGTPDGRWSAQQRITNPAKSVDAYAARVAVSADGGLAMVAWIDHYHGTVQVSKLNAGFWGAADTIGRGTAWASFQEVLGLDIDSRAVARATWKNAQSGTRTMAVSYGR